MNSERQLLERRIGTTIRGKWRLERLIGAGGMAAVYIGLHRIGRRDAIKILHPEIAANKELSVRFEREAHAVNRFRHPGAVEILDVDQTEDGAPFLVMELLDGESLADRIKRAPIDTRELLRIIDELLDVLVAAHGSGIIHRDIKPDNLFLLRDGRLKVLDFGIARMRQGASRTLHTAYGVTIGTLSYMPPEQVAGKEIDARADLFAVGCTIFRMVAGRGPHEGNNDIELMAKMGLEPAPPLSHVAPFAPPDLCAVVDRALAFDRERRYPDARTMQEDVRALREGRTPPYASARLAAGDLPNRAPVSTNMTSGATSAPAASEVISTEPVVISAPMPAPAAASKRHAIIAALAVAATLLVVVLALFVASMRDAPQEEPTVAAARTSTNEVPPTKSSSQGEKKGVATPFGEVKKQDDGTIVITVPKSSIFQDKGKKQSADD